MHLGKLADAYNASKGLPPRSRQSAMFIARKQAGVEGSVKSATLEQMDAMIAYLEAMPACRSISESTDGRHQNPGRPRKPLPIIGGRRPVTRTEATRLANAYWFSQRYNSDPTFALRHSMRRTVATALKRAGFIKKQSSLKIVGCTPSELRRHIELQFAPGMSWLNRSEWHVDHIVPLYSATSEEELLALCHFTNLRPIWAKENLKKSSHRTHLI